MSNCPFCNLVPSSDAQPPSPPPNRAPGNLATRTLRRIWRTTQWLFPTILLLLMPKCPMCIAAYFALITGVGMAATTARWVQILMLTVGWASLAYLVVRLSVRYFKTREWIA